MNQDQCDQCHGTLKYQKLETSNEFIVQPFECTQCGAHGRDVYMLMDRITDHSQVAA